MQEAAHGTGTMGTRQYAAEGPVGGAVGIVWSSTSALSILRLLPRKEASLRERCKAGLKWANPLTKRLDFLKKEKNATRQAAQKVTMIDCEKSIRGKIENNIPGVIGIFCLVALPSDLLAPLRIVSIGQELANGLS